MKSEWLQNATLRLASLLVSGNQRAEWLSGWRSELWYIPRHGAARFCLGAFRDAIWVRRNSEQPARRSALWFESPRSCLAFLTLAATISFAIMVCLPAPDIGGMLLFPAMFLLPALFTTGRGASSHRPPPWPNRLRRRIFLLLKIVLVQPVMLCGFVIMIWIGPAAGPVLLLVQMAYFALCFLTLRWVLLDQRNRCPVCLRLLTEPVRIGAPSQTFLEWYGNESACPCGHGLLQTSEMPSSYCAAPEWHRLDDSWSGLFFAGRGSEAAMTLFSLPLFGAAMFLTAGSLFGQTPSFEVASIKPSQPIEAMIQSGKVHRGMMISGARVDIGNFRLVQLIMKAWDVEMYQVQGPPWVMTGQAFDIMANLPEGATKEQVPGMLQKLLADRFKLQVHMDKQSHDVYALVVAQGGAKLKESAPAAEAPPQGVTGSSTASINLDKNGGGVITDSAGVKYTMTPSPDGTAVHYQASGVTVAEWLKSLPPLLDRPIVDETGLKGRYDVTMDISMQELMTAARSIANVPPPATGGTEALEPGGSLFTAIKSMGLKLEPRKVPMLRVVVDHCEEMPTDN